MSKKIEAFLLFCSVCILFTSKMAFSQGLDQIPVGTEFKLRQTLNFRKGLSVTPLIAGPVLEAQTVSCKDKDERKKITSCRVNSLEIHHFSDTPTQFVSGSTLRVEKVDATLAKIHGDNIKGFQMLSAANGVELNTIYNSIYYLVFPVIVLTFSDSSGQEFELWSTSVAIDIDSSALDRRVLSNATKHIDPVNGISFMELLNSPKNKMFLGCITVDRSTDSWDDSTCSTDILLIHPAQVFELRQVWIDANILALAVPIYRFKEMYEMTVDTLDRLMVRTK